MLDERLKLFWDLESFGIVEEAVSSIHEDFATNIQFMASEVQLP